jgi:hypothetical protein
MKTLVTPQRENDHRPWVPFFSIVQRVSSFLLSFTALQGATIYKEVRINQMARSPFSQFRNSFHVSKRSTL